MRQVQAEIDSLGVETDGQGWRGKVYLYCAEVRCPQTGWMVPLLTTLIVSTGYRVVADLLPDRINKRYQITLRSGVSEEEMASAVPGTIGREGRFGEAHLVHQVNGVKYKTMIATLRGDFQMPNGTMANRLRQWESHDFKPRQDDIFQERLYAVRSMRSKKNGTGDDFEFRSVTPAAVERDRIVEPILG